MRRGGGQEGKNLRGGHRMAKYASKKAGKLTYGKRPTGKHIGDEGNPGQRRTRPQKEKTKERL